MCFGAKIKSEIKLENRYGFNQQSTHVGEDTHVSRFCKEFCNAENPHYPGLVDADGENLGNSEAAEQCFAKLVNFGSTAMNMSYVNCRHYIHFMALLTRC